MVKQVPIHDNKIVDNAKLYFLMDKQVRNPV